jgi:uncharacterized protein (TIGR02444 family)
MNFYEQSSVQEACIELQSRYGVDMEILFFCLQVGASGGGKMTRGNLLQAMEAVSGWQEDIVRPLRMARNCLESSYNNFPEEKTKAIQNNLTQAKLDAEKSEQLQLAMVIPFEQNPHLPEEKRAEDAIANIFLYLTEFAKEKAGISFESNDLISPLNAIFSASFPHEDPQLFRSLIGVQIQRFSARLMSSKTYDAILDSISSPIVFVDNTHTIKYLNKAARIRYYEKRGVSDLIGKSLFNCHSLLSERAIRDIHARLQAGEDEVFLKVDQDRLKITVVGVRDPDGKLIGYYERFEND